MPIEQKTTGADSASGRPPQHRVSAGEVFRQAAILHREGRLPEAVQLYQMVLRVAPDHVESLHCLGFICSQLGRFEDAVVLLRRALAGDPNSARGHHDIGVALQGLRRQEEAIVHYRQAIALAPDLIEAHNNLGNALHALGRAEEALAQFDAALALNPDAAEIHNNLGIALAALGRHDDAITRYATALALRADFAEAHNNLGIALAAAHRPDQAIAHYEKAVALKPRYALAYNNLGNALSTLGRHAEAISHYERALAVSPDYAEAHANLGSALHALKRSSEAVAHFEKAIALKSDDAGAHINLGNALAALERHAEAVAHFEKALAIAPGSAEAHNNFGNALASLERHDEAMRHYREAIAIAPAFAQPHSNLGDAYMVLNRAEEAIACYDRALTIDPQIAEAHRNRGTALLALGSLEQSRQAIETAVALAPQRAGIYRVLAELKRFTPGDPHLAAMEALAGEPAALSEHERIDLHFALGKAYGDIGDHARAFGHLAEGNASQRRQTVYDEAGRLAMFERVKAVFTRELIAGKQGHGDPSALPVFILGMPRSGTTLVEQMLASHPKTFGAGEIMDFIKAIDSLGEPGSSETKFPECVLAMGGEELRRLAACYLETVAAQSPTAARITDKMPSNFFCIGLIHLALPNARIIHMRRDPVDTCFSCFSRLFPVTLPYSYDLGELGRYYRGYEGLMAHWRRVLPENAMLEVQYEALVADFEPQARRIVDYCGLDWDDACAVFYQTRRPVRTASVVQVRQPIYQSSVGRWRPYREMLDPLLDALGVE
jgi:tetratricopeptide (TPR) repeat protein